MSGESGFCQVKPHRGTTMQRTLSFSIIAMIVFASAAVGQSAYFGYIEEPVNPRSAAMGGTGTGMSTGGFAFYNPAGAANIDNPYVAFEFGQQFGELSGGLVEAAWKFPSWFIGTSFQTQSVSFRLSSDIGELIPGTGAQQASMASVFAGIRRDRYAIGAAANGFQHQIYNSNSFAFSASGGIAVSLLPEKLQAGLAILHAGRYHRGFDLKSFEFHRDSMPTSARIGGTWNDTILDRIPVNMAIDAVYSLNFDLLMIPVGFEIQPLQPLFVRIGKRINHPQDVVSLGIGVRWENIAFDAAFTPTSTEGDVSLKWTMGLRYALAGKKPEKTGSVSADETGNRPAPSQEKATTIPVDQPGAAPAGGFVADSSTESADTPQREEVTVPVSGKPAVYSDPQRDNDTRTADPLHRTSDADAPAAEPAHSFPQLLPEERPVEAPAVSPPGSAVASPEKGISPQIPDSTPQPPAGE